MQRVFVLDAERNPLMPCHPARARELLKDGKAAVFKRYPFTVILKERIGGEIQPVQVKVDPGSRQTGIALVATFKRGLTVIWGAELAHKGHLVKKRLESRRSLRRGRRNRKTRYRPARWANRKRDAGWLPPSLMSRIANVETWIRRLAYSVPLTGVSLELVKFDTQQMENPEINGVEYQQGTLTGYEVREYLLEKWGRKCVYCGKENIPLEIEHLVPKTRGGSNRISNLAIACQKCNQKKGKQTASEYGYPQLMTQAKTPLEDAAAVNSARWALYRRLEGMGAAIECGTGGQTKFNRTRQDYPKAHWIDAACVGASGAEIIIGCKYTPLLIKATGRGVHQRVVTDAFGFPKQHRCRAKRLQGFQTGDIVRAKGIIGRISSARSKGGFTINGNLSASPKACQLVQSADGYEYNKFSPCMGNK